MPEMPNVCPKCGTTNFACARVPGTGWVCTCNACEHDWTEVESVLGASAVMVGLWLLLCLAFFVSIYMLKRGGI